MVANVDEFWVYVYSYIWMVPFWFFKYDSGFTVNLTKLIFWLLYYTKCYSAFLVDLKDWYMVKNWYMVKEADRVTTLTILNILLYCLTISSDQNLCAFFFLMASSNFWPFFVTCSLSLCLSSFSSPWCDQGKYMCSFVL